MRETITRLRGACQPEDTAVGGIAREALEVFICSERCNGNDRGTSRFSRDLRAPARGAAKPGARGGVSCYSG